MDRRTSLITAAAIAAVVVAGGTAVAANIGVLGAAGNDSIGQLTASGEIGSTANLSAVTVATIPTGATTADVSAMPTDTQRFQVEDAGTVTVGRVGTGMEVNDVTTTAGWTWATTTTSPTDVAVTFTSPTTVYVFTAHANADGSTTASVNHVIEQPASEAAQPAPAPSIVSAGDDDRGSEHHDDSGELEEHEGGADDD